MQLDSARDLKAALQESVIVPMATSFLVRSAGLSGAADHRTGGLAAHDGPGSRAEGKKRLRDCRAGPEARAGE